MGRACVSVCVALVLVGCGGKAGDQAAEPSKADPATSLLAEGVEVMARPDDPGEGVMVWPKDNDIFHVPGGSTLRVVRDPGPESDPERGVEVYSATRDRTGEVMRGDLRPLAGRPAPE